MIELPPRLVARPRDARGFPITFVTLIDRDGKPDFRVLDEQRVVECLNRRLCGMCGQPMGRHLHFVGGPLCVVNRIFHDPPMHKDCAIYALRACPHLASHKGRFNESPPFPEGIKITASDAISDQKAEWFALMHATDYRWQRQDDGILLIRASEWLDVQRWKNGNPSPESESGAFTN